MENKNIVTFYCDKCGREFDLMHGGICRHCNNMFCAGHLRASNIAEDRKRDGTSFVLRILKHIKPELPEKPVGEGHVCDCVEHRAQACRVKIPA